MEAKVPTSAQEWKKYHREPLEVPSGNVCEVERRPLDALLKKGIIPNSLMPLVQQSMKAAKDTKEIDPMDLVEKDPELLVELLEMVDIITVECVKQPKVHAIPDRCAQCSRRMHEHSEQDHEFTLPDRDPELLYVDEVDVTDKMFIFVYVTTGVRDLESFRSQPIGNVVSIPNGTSVQDPSLAASSD